MVLGRSLLPIIGYPNGGTLSAYICHSICTIAGHWLRPTRGWDGRRVVARCGGIVYRTKARPSSIRRTTDIFVDIFAALFLFLSICE
eukprot:scaffold40295_cov46-Attheya_sp.AAC.4